MVRLGAVMLAAALMVIGGGAGLLLAQTPPPAAPTDLIGDALSDTEIQLNWQDTASDETGYRVERSPFDSVQWQEVASLEADTTTYVDTGLTCDTSYFYRVRAYRATDETFSDYTELISVASGTCPLPDIQPFSDTFSSNSLLPGWRFYDPYVNLGPPAARAALNLTGTNAEISVPGGEPHDLWRGANNMAPRLLQPVPNQDFAVEVRFESVPSTRYQLQGIVVQESDTVLLRLDVFHTGSSLDVFATYITGDQSVVFADTQVTDIVDQVYLRVIRTGDHWEYLYSPDGLTWTVVAEFDQALAVTEVGFFAGNSSDPAPPYRASADYFMNLADPVTDTDGFGAPPPAPPETPSGLTSEITDGHVVLSWDEDNLTEGQYLIERSSNPEAGWDQVGEAEAGQTSYEDLTVTCGLAYQYRMRALHAGDERISRYSETIGVETGACVDDPGSPTIDVFYADENDTLYFGQIGNPARWLNVLGNVSDPDGLELVTYAMNGGLEEPVPLGPDETRLVYPGDFNIEVDRTTLTTGRYILQIKAVDTTGATAYRTLTIDYTDGNVWPIPYSVDWRQVTDINEVAQVLDGQWELTPEGLHVARTGYDRLVAIGSDSWEGNYEAVLTFTLHTGPVHSSTGLAIGWQGHEGSNRPRTRWPLEALTWLNTFNNDPRERITIFPGPVVAQLSRPDVVVGGTYKLHVRTERLGNGLSRVAQRLWRADLPEPETWDISADLPERSGSLLLITHLADVTFHSIDIFPLRTETPPIPPTPRPTRTPSS